MADPTPDARGSTGVRPLHPPAPHAGINPDPTRFGTSTSTQPRTNRDTPAWRSSVGRPLPRPLRESTAMTEDLKPAQPRARGSTRARGSMRQMRPQPRRAGIDRTRQLNLKPDATPTTSAITSSDCWFGRQRRHLPRVCGDQPQQDMRAPLLQDATPRARGSTEQDGTQYADRQRSPRARHIWDRPARARRSTRATPHARGWTVLPRAGTRRPRATPPGRGSTPAGAAPERAIRRRYPARAGIDLRWCGVGPATPNTRGSTDFSPAENAVR